MIGTPKTRWPVNPIARGTELTSTNSTYAIPLERLEFLSEIILTSRTFPTVEKNSSKSLGRILAASCMQKTVLASLSSGVRLSIGSLTGLLSFLNGLLLRERLLLNLML